MVSATIGGDPYKTELVATGHSLIADEPEEAGGGNLGPSPGQLLQLSLASCTAITLRMYVRRKNIVLKNIRVEVDTVRFPDKTVFRRDVYLEGDITEEERAKLLDIANACPVHRTLTHPIEIETKIVNHRPS
jgi:putative redox protein